jgi:hypothetical protein
MHGLHTGALTRRILMVGAFMLVMLVLATHVTVARADTGSFTTAITSPSDPSYFYDPTAGALGAITVTGTTTGTDPSSAGVDIECYNDDGSTAGGDGYGDYDVYPLVTGVALDSNGDFSTTIPYSRIEEQNQEGICRLRAVPSVTAPATPPTGELSGYAGPRVMLAYLDPGYTPGGDSHLSDWQVIAPQLAAVDSYTAASDPYGDFYSAGVCGLGMQLVSPQFFGATSSDESFQCADPFNNGNAGVGGIEIDTSQYGTQQAQDSRDSGDPITVQVTQDSGNGDITIQETEPLQICPNSNCIESGIVDDRTIQQAADGKVVMITDKFVNSGSQDAQVTFDTNSEFDMGASLGGTDHFQLPDGSSCPDPSSSYPSDDPTDLEPSDGQQCDLGSGSGGTIYSENDSFSGVSDGSGGFDAGNDALTYFASPSGAATFSKTWYYGPVSVVSIPFTVDAPAGGSGSVKLAYASEYSPAALAGDFQTELDLQTAPTIAISSPAAGGTVSTSSVTVTGSVSAATGVESVSVDGRSATVSGSTFAATVPLSSGANTITAVMTTNSGVTASDTESVTYTPPTTTTTTTTTPITPASGGKWAGPVWLPIADTGTAKRAGARKEKLSGRVTAGSGSVTYYFEYGTHGNLAHRTASVELNASTSSQRVRLTIGDLRRGTKYTYRLVATGSYGHSAGRSRSFKTTAHKR